MFKYSDFLAFIKEDGLAKQNRFYINITKPASSTFSKYKNVDLLCNGVQLPGVQLATTNVRYTGEQFEVPYDRNFAPATLSFYVDRNMYTKMFFDIWINVVQNANTRKMGYYNEYVSPEIHIYVTDKADRQVYEIILYNAYPKFMGTVALDQNNVGPMTLDVTFEYRYYDTICSDSQGVPDTMSPMPSMLKTSVNSFNNFSLLKTGNELPTSTVNSLTKQIGGVISNANGAITLDGKSLLINGQTAMQGITDAGIASVKANTSTFATGFVEQQYGNINGAADQALKLSTDFMRQAASTALNNAVSAAYGVTPNFNNIITNSQAWIAGQTSQAISSAVGSIGAACDTATGAVSASGAVGGDQTFMSSSINNVVKPALNSVISNQLGSLQSTINSSIYKAVFS